MPLKAEIEGTKGISMLKPLCSMEKLWATASVGYFKALGEANVRYEMRRAGSDDLHEHHTMNRSSETILRAPNEWSIVMSEKARASNEC